MRADRVNAIAEDRAVGVNGGARFWRGGIVGGRPIEIRFVQASALAAAVALIACSACSGRPPAPVAALSRTAEAPAAEAPPVPELAGALPPSVAPTALAAAKPAPQDAYLAVRTAYQDRLHTDAPAKTALSARSAPPQPRTAVIAANP